MSRPQRIVILGSTGSVGTSTLDVIARHPGRFEVWGLSGNRQLDELVAQCRRWQPRVVAVPGEPQARARRSSSSRSPTERGGSMPAAMPSSVRQLTAWMAVKAMRRSRKASTATSLAALSTVVVPSAERSAS